MSNSWQVIIKNIVYTSNVTGGTISYKLHNSENWIIVGENNYFEVVNPRCIRYKIDRFSWEQYNFRKKCRVK